MGERRGGGGAGEGGKCQLSVQILIVYLSVVSQEAVTN